MKTLATLGILSFLVITGASADGPPPVDTPTQSIAHDFTQTDHDGVSWKFDEHPTVYMIGGEWSGKLAAKAFDFDLEPGQYNVTVTITARHSDPANLVAAFYPTLSYNEQGGINTGPDYAFYGTTWTDVSFTTASPVDAAYLNDPNLVVSFRCAVGNDAEEQDKTEIQSVRIVVTLAR